MKIIIILILIVTAVLPYFLLKRHSRKEVLNIPDLPYKEFPIEKKVGFAMASVSASLMAFSLENIDIDNLRESKEIKEKDETWKIRASE